MSRNVVLVALATASAAVSPVMPASATDLSSISVHASFVGAPVVGPCDRSTCVLTARSQVCEAVGVNARHVPFADACEAELVLSVRATGTGAARVCSGTATGTFTISYLGEDASLHATAVVSPAKAVWETQPMLSLSGLTYVGHGSGVVAPPCGTGEGTSSAFQGTFDYVRVP